MQKKIFINFFFISLCLLILLYSNAQAGPKEELDDSDFLDLDPEPVKIQPKQPPKQPQTNPTTAPQSTAPQSTAPQSATPQSTAPQSTAPQSTAPQSTAPQSTAPQSTAPQSATPQSTAPQSTAPQSTAPQTKPSKQPNTPTNVAKPNKPAPSSEPEFDEPESEGLQSSKYPVRIMEERGTQYIQFSGFLGLNYMYRNDLFADAHAGATTTNLDEDFFDLRFGLQAKIQLNNKIRAVIELQAEPRQANLLTSSLDHLYISNRAGVDEFKLHFEKAYLQIDDFLLDHLWFRAGIIPHKYSLRADGQAFFINFAESESPFSTRADTHAIGILANYQPLYPAQLYLEAFYFVTAESSFQRQDETVFGLNIDFDMTKKIQNADESTSTMTRFFNLIFAGIQGDNQQPIWSIGAGAVYVFSDDPQTYLIEAYAESLFQFGEYRNNLKEPFSGTKVQDHLAFGGYLGLRFSYEKSDWKPYIDVSGWYISGDDDAENRKKNRDLVTYEDIDSTLVLEDNDYGLDIDSNYWAIKFKAGVSLKPIIKEDMKLNVMYSHFRALDAGPHHSKDLGNEVDVRLIWEYSSDLTFSLAAGYLFHSRFLEQFYDSVGAKGRKDAFIIRVESMLRF